MTERHQVYRCELCGSIVHVLRQLLNPGEPPEATFEVKAAKVAARELCNMHGLWKGGAS